MYVYTTCTRPLSVQAQYSRSCSIISSACYDGSLVTWTVVNFQYQAKVTLRLAASQSVSLGVEPHLGLMTRYLLLFDSYGLVFVGCPLGREEEFVFCICCWPLPAQSFSGPSPLGLATVFYCLRFETSLFVASYDSQGHGGGIRLRLHKMLGSSWVAAQLAASKEGLRSMNEWTNE
jgi:hypothetical protein